MVNNYEDIIQEVATALHDIWRKARNYEPRLKKVTDVSWITQHDNATECDIANTLYYDLPREWKAENEASAKVAVGIIYDALIDGCKSVDDVRVETASALIHVAWLERNGQWAEPLQKLDYFDPQFPEYERERDRVVWREAIRIWKETVK